MLVNPKKTLTLCTAHLKYAVAYGFVMKYNNS